MKPICVQCQRFYRPKKNGFAFIEGKPSGFGLAPPGKNFDEHWEDYKLWMGDLWACPDCGIEIIVGTGAAPLSEHYMPDFIEQKRIHNPAFRVNDC